MQGHFGEPMTGLSRHCYSPREVTWQGGAIVMDQCIMKQVICVFANNRKHVRMNSLTYAFLVVNKNSTLPTSYVKSRGEVDM